jgi:hypothetical protein
MFAQAPPGFHAGSVAYGPVLNVAAVFLSCHRNVPADRFAAVDRPAGQGRRLGRAGRQWP